MSCSNKERIQYVEDFEIVIDRLKREVDILKLKNKEMQKAIDNIMIRIEAIEFIPEETGED